MIERVTGKLGLDGLSQVKIKKLSPGGGDHADQVNFSSFAVELSRVSGELRNIPDVRQELVDDFKEKVENGEYHPPLEKIAHNLFLAGILRSD